MMLKLVEMGTHDMGHQSDKKDYGKTCTLLYVFHHKNTVRLTWHNQMSAFIKDQISRNKSLSFHILTAEEKSATIHAELLKKYKLK